MKSRDEIERLQVLANQQVLTALETKASIKKTTYGYAEKLKEANTQLGIASGAAHVLRIILEEGPLSPEDERYFLSQA